MKIKNIPCFVCEKELDNIMEDKRGNQPSNGLEFTTYGHYGSTFFDPMDGTRLAINICDKCLVEKRNLILGYDNVYYNY